MSFERNEHYYYYTSIIPCRLIFFFNSKILCFACELFFKNCHFFQLFTKMNQISENNQQEIIVKQISYQIQRTAIIYLEICDL